ncbi:MAG: FAD-dependent monooxygenase [Ilumatobacteraceae bacterium]
MSTDIETPVLIVGGGGAGLTASMLLSTLGVESLLVSALPTTSTLPKAHILNQRAMEILNDTGVAGSIYAVGTPPEQFANTAVYVGFSGRPEAGSRLAKLECWGNGGRDAQWVAASPLLSTNLPQIRLEPILRARAEQLAPGRVRFHHELTGFEQDADGVTATVVDRDNDREYTVRSRYMIACDGGRTVGRILGVEMQGQRRYASQVSIHLSTDFSRLAHDDDVLIRWHFMPEIGAMVVMVPMGPGKWGTGSPEWVVHLNYPADDPRTFDDAKVEQDLRSALGIGDHPMQIHRISVWAAEGIIADRFTHGRVFLAGDAAHKHPPTGGLGLTSGMHDVQNLTWKLAAVLNGHAGEALLDTYEPERRSSIEKNVRRSLENSAQWAITARALRVNDPALTVEQRWAHLSRAWSGRPEDAAFAREVGDILAVHSMEFREQNIEYGYTYESPAVIPDGTDARQNPDPVRIYLMEARPGHPLPHAWVEEGQGGRRESTVNLVRPGRFLLIAGEDGGMWCDAAVRMAAEAGVPLDAVTIGHSRGDWLDPRLTWVTHRGHSPSGAVLVRPDRFVAWRCEGEVSNPYGEMHSILARVLAR